MTDQFEWWRAALRGEWSPVDQNKPRSGFYESRSKNRTTNEVRRTVVAIWADSMGTVVCKHGDTMVSTEKMLALWPWIFQRPIEKELYDAIRAGKPWPNQHPAVERDRANAANAPDPNSFEAIKDRVEDLAREADLLIARGAAKTKDESDAAADLSNRLRELEKRAEDLRREHKRPHEDAAKAVDHQWSPVRNRADDCKRRLKSIVITPFELGERRRHEAAEAAAIKQGIPGPQPLARTTAGTVGRAVGLRKMTTVVVVDHAAALAHFANHEKVKEVVAALARAAFRAGGEISPGCDTHETEVAA